MKSFYEKSREDDTLLQIHISENHSFPLHFHANLEVLIVLRGEYALSVNGKDFKAGENTVSVMDSYDVHGYQRTKAHEAEDARLIILPYRFLHTFNAVRKGMKVRAPIVKDGALCRTLVTVADAYLRAKSERVQTAGAELFLAFLADALTFAPDDTRSEGALVRAILSYIAEHYREECTRARVARALGYTQAHISRVFHKYLQRGIPEYVNGLRLDFVEDCKRLGDGRTTEEIVYDAGFNSMQTYYRQKAKREGQVRV